MRVPDARILAAIVLAAVAGVALLASRFSGGVGEAAREERPAPVEVGAVERGPIALRRTFSGSLEALAQFDVAPKVGGRIERLHADVGDLVERGQVVAELDNDEFVQDVALAEAERAVARASVGEARSRAETARRALGRATALGERGVASEAQLDTARNEQQAARAALQVAEAQVERAEAALESARIRLDYTTVAASWVGGDARRVVAERFVDAGDTVSANTPLLRIVQLDPIKAVVSVTERDYGHLEPGMPAELTTDAYPGRRFRAEAVRIAPVFQEASRQARVELLAENADRALKPGMFIRATLVLDRAEDALTVPEAALTRRGEEYGVFVVDEEGGASRARWRPVEVGIRGDGRVQVRAPDGLAGPVVTLGQQLIDDGSPIVVPEGDGARPGTG